MTYLDNINSSRERGGNHMKPLEMKKCKECGKLFMPTSNKQKYCSEDHYRPCPVCGKLIFAKYLSDPARCCSGTCKSKLGKLNKIEEYIANGAKIVERVASDLGIEVPNIESIQIVEPKVEDTLDLSGTTRKKFATYSNDGWTEGHEYATVVTQVGKEHIVKASFDYTADEIVYLEYGFTNKKKISTIFKACR